METKKKQFKMPHTFVIIGIIILLAVLLTWIIPAGSYTRFENEAGIKVIDPNDFNYIDKTPVNPLEIPLYIVKAFIKRIDLMLVIMFAGGAFHILTKTGALHAVVAKMAKVFSTRVYLFLPILTLVFGLICTTQGVNLFIAFAPIMVMMAFAIGLDSITGASIILLGGAIGFSTGPLNINTTIVAQKIAGLPLYSGVGYRFICFAVFYVITNIYLIRYALKIQKHPELSPMYELDKTSEFRDAADLDSFGKLDARKILIMLVFFASLILIVYGGIKLDWDMSETASVFLALAVIEGVLGGFGPPRSPRSSLRAAKDAGRCLHHRHGTGHQQHHERRSHHRYRCPCTGKRPELRPHHPARTRHAAGKHHYQRLPDFRQRSGRSCHSHSGTSGRPRGRYPSDRDPFLQLRRRLLQLRPAHFHRSDGHHQRCEHPL